jgi:subtilisin family serine protease
MKGAFLITLAASRYLCANRRCDRNRDFVPMAVACCLLAVLGLNACSSGLTASFRTDSRLLVKVPGDEHTIVKSTSTGQWHFRHIIAAPHERDRYKRFFVGQWYVAWRQGPSPRQSSASQWVQARALAPELADATRRAFGVYPLIIEPSLVFKGEIFPTGGSAATGHTLKYDSLPSAVWPEEFKTGNEKGKIDPFWYFDDIHSQLAGAREEVKTQHHVILGILDNGFSSGHAGVPENLDDSPDGNAVETLDRDWHSSPLKPGSTNGSHGTGTLGILAGGYVDIPESKVKGRTIAAYHGYLGGAPHAKKVVLVRIAPWVVSLTTADLAYGIDYASRIKGCDVLSLSHGGAPSQAWADAINAAYNRGTAMFAAESDFFSLAFDPIQPRGVLIPASPVYPAQFRRVIGVTGVTADGQSYAKNFLSRLIQHPLSFGDWIFRGSYGPDGSWLTKFGSSEVADPSETTGVHGVGMYRAYPIAAYSPNIPWSAAPSPENQFAANSIVINGAGTSAATPQVAAAAALWLEKHHAEFDEKSWHSWKKSEAVYDALLASAYRDPKIKIWPDRYLGVGALKAKAALRVSLKDIQRFKDKQFIDYHEAPRDFADGARSLAALFGLVHHVPIAERADLRQISRKDETREEALKRIYFNMILLEKWQNGRLPRADRDEPVFEARAAELAAAAER